MITPPAYSPTGAGEFISYRFYECIDVDVVEAIIEENCGLEVRWLRNALEAGIWIRGRSGRRIKGTSLIKVLEKL